MLTEYTSCIQLVQYRYPIVGKLAVLDMARGRLKLHELLRIGARRWSKSKSDKDSDLYRAAKCGVKKKHTNSDRQLSQRARGVRLDACLGPHRTGRGPGLVWEDQIEVRSVTHFGKKKKKKIKIKNLIWATACNLIVL